MEYTYSQKIFTTDYPSQSHLEIFVIDCEPQSDLKIFFMEYKSKVRFICNINHVWFEGIFFLKKPFNDYHLNIKK